ncbi:NAD(P)H oxidoreductase [Bifidobacterium lemurum]|uniref:NAD(P)H oxidoreductase n=1 Tax=Bifidobacterium lemurum TaxID=1603886 RepID=A0A261FVV4_9BIFI|nr:NAD(P)H-dependent oxidoreductase [Bifidobacterium lemurum]OZG63324.1 NAD(P)H oxidoreductase [Bifidobacterium lemurum]QOL34240.1 NAD(P)H-dependent oxidoreductase [Bifidobacterium lemurum]
MANTLILAFHPNMNESRVNRRLLEATRGMADVTVRDEYVLYPDFAIDVKAEQRLVEDHDRIVWQFPFYWYSSPALLKQWQDDVLEYGWAYGSTGDKLHGKELMVAVSAGGAGEKYTKDGEFGITVPELLAPMRATANHIGMTWLDPFILPGTLNLSDDELEAAAGRYAQALGR